MKTAASVVEEANPTVKVCRCVRLLLLRTFVLHICRCVICGVERAWEFKPHLQGPSCDVCKTYVTVLRELKGQYSHCQCTQIWKLSFKEFSGNDADGPQYWAETTTIVPGPAPFTVKPRNSSWCVNVRNWRNDTTINDAVVAVAVIALESVCSSKRCSGDSSNGCRNSSIAYSVLNARCNRCSNRQRRLPRVFTASQCCRRSPVINVS